jgi:hypothetical protein
MEEKRYNHRGAHSAPRFFFACPSYQSPVYSDSLHLGVFCFGEFLLPTGVSRIFFKMLDDVVEAVRTVLEERNDVTVYILVFV